MTKIRAEKLRLNRSAPKRDHFLETSNNALSVIPPQFEVRSSENGDENESSNLQDKRSDPQKQSVEVIDEKILALHSQVLPKAKGNLKASEMPALPKTGGHALPSDQRAAYEKSLGIDLGDVRIHSSQEAQDAVKALGAEALTHETDIYLKEPLKVGDPMSERMLAHELLHVKQFMQGKVPGKEGNALSSPSDALEVEAYGKENEVAKESLELRGESTNSPILNQSFTPPPARQEEGAAEGDGLEGMNEILDQPSNENSLEENKDAPADEGDAEGTQEEARGQQTKAGAEKPGADGDAAGEVPSAKNAETKLPPVSAKPGIKPLPKSERPTIDGNGIELVPAAKTNAGDEKKAIDMHAEADRVQGLARTKAATLRVSGSRRLVAYKRQNETTKTGLRETATSTKAQLAAAFAAQAQALQGKASAQLGGIDASAVSQKAILTSVGAAELQRFTAGKDAELAAALAAVTAKKAATQNAASDAATRATTESEADAQTILTEASSFPIGSEAEANDAKRKALTDIANDTAEKIRKNGNEVAINVTSEGGAFSKRYDEAHQEYLLGIEKEAAQYVEKATDLCTSVGLQIDSAARQAREAVNVALAQGQQALEAEQRNAETVIDRQLEQYIAQIDGAATQVEGEFRIQYTQAAEQVETYGQTSHDQLLRASSHDSEGVKTAVGQIEEKINQFATEMESGFATWEDKTNSELAGLAQAAGGDFAQTMDSESERAASIGTGLGTEIDNAGQAALDGMCKLVTDTQVSVTAATDEMLGSLGKSRSDLEVKFEAIYVEAVANLTQFVTDGLQAGKNLLVTARGKMGEAVSEIDSKYASLRAEAEAKNGQVSSRVMRGFWSWLGGVVESVGRWFEATFGAWLGGILFGLLQAIVVVLIGLAVFWVLGAILAACAVAAEVIAVVLLVVGLVIGIGFGIYNRWQEYKIDHHGEGPSGWWILGVGVLGILDITGIPFIVEGMVGTRATGGELTDFQRGERIAMGVVFLIAFGVSAVKAFRGSSPKVPVEDPLRVPVEEARIPVEEPVAPVEEPRVPVEEPRAPVEEPRRNPKNPEYRPCFLAGTKVLTPSGPVNIEDLAGGSQVQSLGDDSPGFLANFDVTATLIGKTEKVIEIIGDGGNLLATRDHQFLVAGEGWMPAKSLETSHRLTTPNGELRISSVREIELAGNQATYNITVDIAHTYFVLLGESWVLVHNDDPFGRELYWLFGKKPDLRPGDVDGLSIWKTNSRAEVNTFFETRVHENLPPRSINDVHSYYTADQLANLEIVRTPSENILSERGLEHYSLRPKEVSADPAYRLTEAEMTLLESKLSELPKSTNVAPKALDGQC